MLIGQQMSKLYLTPVKGGRIYFLRLALKLFTDFDNAFQLFYGIFLFLKGLVLEVLYKFLLDLLNAADLVAEDGISDKFDLELRFLFWWKASEYGCLFQHFNEVDL